MEQTYQPFQTKQPARRMNVRILRWLIALVVVVGLVFAGWQLYLSTTLYIVKTDPGLGNVGAVSPYVKLYFNEPLIKDQLSIQTDSNITGYTLDDKVVTVNLNQNLTVGKEYTILIKSATSSSGKQLQNKHLVFEAKNIPFDKLSKDQQQAAIASQDQYPYSVTSIEYVGFDELLNRGLSSNQVQSLKSNLFSYSVQSGKDYKKMTVDIKSIVLTPHDPRGSNPTDKAAFNIKLDDTQFKVKMTYSGLSAASIQLYGSSGKLFYDSTAAHD